MDPQGSPPLRLEDEAVAAIARRVVKLLTDSEAVGLIDAAELARRLGVSRDAIYRRADELAAARVGDGKRGRLRFDPEEVAKRLSSGQAKPEAPPQRRDPHRRPSRSTRTPLLPIAGQQSSARGVDPRRAA